MTASSGKCGFAGSSGSSGGVGGGRLELLRDGGAVVPSAPRARKHTVDRARATSVNVRMQQGKPAYSHVVTVTGPAKMIYIAPSGISRF